MPIQALGAVMIQQNGSLVAFSNTEVDGAGGTRRKGDRDDLAALASDRQGAVTAFHALVLDVSVEGFGEPQPVERQQVRQGVVAAAGAGRTLTGHPTCASSVSRLACLARRVVSVARGRCHDGSTKGIVVAMNG